MLGITSGGINDQSHSYAKTENPVVKPDFGRYAWQPRRSKVNLTCLCVLASARNKSHKPLKNLLANTQKFARKFRKEEFRRTACSTKPEA